MYGHGWRIHNSPHCSSQPTVSTPGRYHHLLCLFRSLHPEPASDLLIEPFGLYCCQRCRGHRSSNSSRYDQRPPTTGGAPAPDNCSVSLEPLSPPVVRLLVCSHHLHLRYYAALRVREVLTTRCGSFRLTVNLAAVDLQAAADHDADDVESVLGEESPEWRNNDH